MENYSKTIKNVFITSLFALTLVLSFTFLFPTGMANAQETQAPLEKSELLEKKVDPKKVDSLLNKMKNGSKLDSDIYLEVNGESGLPLASSENTHFRKDFPDGSFIESNIEDITEDNLISPTAIEQIGGGNEYRTLRVSHTAPWGFQAFTVKILFPLGGYAQISQAYDWYYIGLVNSVDYRGIYRKNETASQDAVAIQRLQIGLKGISFVSKFDFRIRDGRYWTVYKS